MPTSPPPTRPIIRDWPKFSPMFGHVPSIKVAQDVQLDRAVQEPFPTQGEMGPGVSENIIFQTKVSPADPTNTAFTHPSSIVDILPAKPTPLTCGSYISLPGPVTLQTHLERLSKITEGGARNLCPESDGKHKKRRLDTSDYPDSCSTEMDMRSPKAVLYSGREKSESTRAAQVGMIGQSQDPISLADGTKAHSEGELQSQRRDDNFNPGFKEVPNKRICLGLDFPKSFQFAHTPPRPKGIVLIVELMGLELMKVHRLARKTAESLFEQHFRGKSGRFFNRNLQIVELDRKKTGATRISKFFQQEDVLIFQRVRHDSIFTKLPANKTNAKSPAKKINPTLPAKKTKKTIEKVVIRNKYPGSPRTHLHKYNLRPRTRG
ncbi:hypothetical protein LTR66_014283 [Elasticomyces elasticus]|nr:hypothetical protein LTR66_014283 [Elasticomyces elasticus]